MAAAAFVPVWGAEETNTCRTTMENPCYRTGTCSIQGSDWFQSVQIDRADIFDTQGWPGVCDMVHVALVQGNCEPPGAQTNLIAYLSETSFAEIPSISGALACAGSVTGGAGVVPDGGPIPGPPLQVVRTAQGELILSWGDSCQAGDIDYAVYEGTIGEGFTSHAPLTCSTGGATTITIAPGPGSHYYLIVPLNGLREGSYGFDSSGRSRPTSVDPCLPQEWSCP
jgi:hypothetical protein